MSTLTTERTSGRSLISPDLFDRLVRRIVGREKIARQMAERIMDQALAFLMASAENPDVPLAPSRAVDVGWHEFILDTSEYAAFCARIASRFIHHCPTDDDRTSTGESQNLVTRTAEAIRSLGFAVDSDLWRTSESGRCSQCKNGCTDDPPPYASTAKN